MKPTRLFPLAILVVLAVSWVSSANGHTSGMSVNNLTSVPISSKSTSPTVPADNAVSLFASKCAACHGKDGAGLPNWKSKGQPNLTKSEWQDSHTDEEIADTIKNGKGEYMPPFKDKLSDEEIIALVSRLRMFKKEK